MTESKARSRADGPSFYWSRQNDDAVRSQVRLYRLILRNAERDIERAKAGLRELLPEVERRFPGDNPVTQDWLEGVREDAR